LSIDSPESFSVGDEVEGPGNYTVTAEKIEPEVKEEPKKDLPNFDEKHKQDLEGLLYLGKLSKTFRWAGHKFKIRTLTTQDILEVGRLSKPYIGTSAEMRAWQAAMAGACTVSVDGQVIYPPLNPGETEVEAHFRWANDQYPWTIDKIFEQLMLLDGVVAEVLEEMGKVSGASTA
jgi:hypothetical protein